MNLPWYKDGLNFKCTGCGKCCSGSPGYVFLSEEEIEKIASYLNLTVEAFAKKYIRLVNGRYSLIELKRGIDYECVFLKGKFCQIYEVRPTQCQTYPWWPQNLSSKEDWQNAQKECEGINNEAPKVDFEIIEKELNRQRSQS